MKLEQNKIDVLNYLVRTAINFGGDAGGPWCSCPKELSEAMDKLSSEYENLAVVNNNTYPYFVNTDNYKDNNYEF